MFLSFLLNRFTILCYNGSASDTLAGGMYLSGNQIDGNRILILIGKAAPQLCASSSSVTQSATCKIGQLGISTFVLSRALQGFAASDATTATTSTGRMGLVHDSISRRCEGMGSLECRRAAPRALPRRHGTHPGRHVSIEKHKDMLSCHCVLDPAGRSHVVPDGIMRHRHQGMCSISPSAS